MSSSARARSARAPRLQRAAALCGIGAAALALATPLLGGAARPGYDHCARFISELGERGAAHAGLVRFGGFLPIGVLALLFDWSCGVLLPMSARARTGLLLFSGVGWAYVIAAFFPCDPGCPSPGSITQQIHSSGALLEYVGGGTGLLLLRRPWRARFRRSHLPLAAVFCAAAVFAAFAGILIPGLQPQRGLLQRVAEAALFGWMLAAGWQLLGTARTSARG